MTREGAKALLPIIQAYSEGKTIEYLTTKDKWVELEDPRFNYNVNLYRIKLEPKYRPFKNGDECFEEMKKHEPFGWLKPKLGKCFTFIRGINSINVGINWDVCTYEQAFDDFIFVDGTPFGIREN